MRLTLEQLKAMTPYKVKQVWSEGKFPFDHLADCHQCMTGHHPGYSFCCEQHPLLSRAIATTIQDFNDALDPVTMHAHLEELYALRLFYDSLYPQTETPTPQTEQAVAEIIVNVEVCEK